MKKYIKIYLMILVIMHLSFVSLCQDSTVIRPYQASKTDALLALHMTLPSDEMQKAIQNNMGNKGIGLSLQVLSNPMTWGKVKRESPVRIGAEIGYTYYGRFIQEVNVNGYQGDFKTSYGIANINAILRLRPPFCTGFLPFVDFIAGGNFYLSSMKENLSAIESALGTQAIDFGGTSSASFNKGIAAGFSIGQKKPEQLRYYFRASYNRGSSISYVERNSLQYDPPRNAITYNKNRAPVNYWMIQLGIGI
jgi:hypothetical protein